MKNRIHSIIRLALLLIIMQLATRNANAQIDFTYSGICSASNVQFTPQVPYPVANWYWNFGDPISGSNNISNLSNPTHWFYSAGNYQITLTVTYTNATSASITKSVTIVPASYAGFITNSCCLYDTILFIDWSLTGNGHITQYDWNFGDGTSQTVFYPNNPNVTHHYTAIGQYEASQTILTSDGCTHTFERDVLIWLTPVDFYYSAGCTGSPKVFTIDTIVTNVGSIISWLWDFGDGTSSMLQNPIHIYTAPGTYTVSLTAADSSTCSNTASHNVTIIQPPVAAFTHNVPVCKNQAVMFTDISTSGTNPIEEWSWNFGDGTVVNIVPPASPDISHLYNYPGTFLVTLSVTTAQCTSNLTQQLIVNPPPVSGFISTGACFGNAVQFSDQSLSNNGGAIISWQWNFGDPASGAYNYSSLQNPSHAFSNPGIYSVILIAGNIYGCNDSIIQSVTVINIPQASFSFSIPVLNEPVQFTDLSIPGSGTIASWAWDFGDGNVSSLENPTHTYTLPGDFIVTLAVNNTSGCSSTISFLLTVSAGPGGITVFGSVYAGAETLNEVSVELLQVDDSGSAIAMNSSSPGINNNFIFENIPSGSYYLLAKPDAGSTYASQYLPTYFGNNVYWEDATLLIIGSAQNPYDIHLATYSMTAGGTFVINGQIVIGGKSFNLANQVVLLLDSSNTPVGYTFTDSEGHFSFTSLPAGSYSIKPVITGFTTFPCYVILDGSTSPAFVTMTAAGQLITELKNITTLNLGFNIFPNPANAYLTITSKEIIDRIVFENSQGQILSDVFNPGRYYIADVNGFPSGVCFVKIMTRGGEYIEKVVVIH